MTPKTTLTNFFLLAIAAVTLVSCNIKVDLDGKKGSGNVTTQTRDIAEDFQKIDAGNGIEVLVEQSDSTAVTVETDDNLQNIIITQVKNHTLIIESSESFNSTGTTKVTVKMPVIKGLSTNSGASLKSINSLDAEAIELKSSSGSSIDIDVEADNLIAESSSGSKIEISGKALRLDTASSSGSEIDAEELLANEIVSQASSGSAAKVNPIVSLKGKASSGGSVKYKNIPKTVEKEESSGGSVYQD